MNRKQFLESQGATCQNWNWSWSFINEPKRIIYFGVWDVYSEGSRALVFSEDWRISRRGRKQPGYAQSWEHIRLVLEEGYTLMTFPMVYSDAAEEGGIGPAKIERIIPELKVRFLARVGSSWFACDDAPSSVLPEELIGDSVLLEGAAITVQVNAYERNAIARSKCLAFHGCSCMVCGFNFEAVFGTIGRNYIHVHHIVPLSERKQEYVVDPIEDLVPVCPNCHAMIHLARPCLTIDQLKEHLAERVGA